MAAIDTFWLLIRVRAFCLGMTRFFMQTPAAMRQHRLCFEITEDSAIANLDKTVNFMSRLREMGCHFSLDDFGTGLSSFTYLQKLPVDSLKIDGSFVRDLVYGSYEYTFIEAMCAISKNLNIYIVAEWVEKQEVLDLVTMLGVDYVQGYLIEKAEPLITPHHTSSMAV